MIGVIEFASLTEGTWERVDEDDTLEQIMACQVEHLLTDD